MNNIVLPEKVVLKHLIQVNTAVSLSLVPIFVFAVESLFLVHMPSMILGVDGPIFMKLLQMGL